MHKLPPSPSPVPGSPFPRRLFALISLLVVPLFSCGDDPVATQPGSHGDEDDGVSESLTQVDHTADAVVAEGCALLTVQVAGVDSVAVSADDEGCGPLAAVPVGPHLHDRVEGVVTLELAVENRGDSDVDGPVAIAILPDSADVTDPPGLERSAIADSLVVPLEPDSTVGPDADEWPGASIWLSNEDPDSGDRPPEVRQRFSGLSVTLRVQDGVRAFTVRVPARGQQVTGIPVPQAAPDTVPVGLLDEVDEEWQVPVDVLAVTFAEEATDQEKSAAAGIAGATSVVGGVRLPSGLGLDGIYLFRIASDGTMAPLLDAIESLKELPQVVSAFTYSQLNAQRTIPDDGPGWDEWRVDPTLADSDNWAQELVAAPLAWGCTTGSRTPRISVIDREFAPVADLAPNLANSIQSPGSGSHGVRVASLLAAVGDNGNVEDGMTGMMWNAELTLRDYGQGPRNPTANVIDELAASVAAGDQVVNLSSSYYWEPRHDAPPSSSTDSMVVLEIYETMRDHLDGMARVAPDAIPLLVVPAGNDGISAFWAALPNLVEDFPDRVVVVGGTERAQPSATGAVGLWTGSNTGPLIDLAAPAEDVYSLDRNGNVSRATGTSYAAPLVSGTAGLLLAFDPTIPVEDLKGMILEGAGAGGLTGGPHPLLNAYEALKVAARRNGAPLCGSRIAADGRSVLAERESGWEQLFTMNGSRGSLIARHGGRIVDAYVSESESFFPRHEDRFELSSSGWNQTGSAPALNATGVLDGSVYNSQKGTSHSADTTVTLDFSGSNLHPNFELRVHETANYFDGVHHIHRFQVAMSNDSSQVCLHRITRTFSDGTTEFRCRHLEDSFTGDLVRGGAAWNPLDGTAVVWITRGTRTEELVSGWYACGDPDDPNDTNECRDRDRIELWNETVFYEMDVVSGDMQELFTLPSDVQSVAVSEDGDEITIMTKMESFTRETRWEPRENQFGNILPARLSTRHQEFQSCSVEWRSMDSGDVLATAPFDKTCFVRQISPEGSTRTYDWWIGTMAP